MKILVDTSVWSLALRRRAPSNQPEALRLAELIQSGQTIYLLGIILQEILSGIRHTEQFAKLRVRLEPFPLISLDRDDFVHAAELSCLCRKQGIQAGTIDCLIAGAAIRHGCKLFTSDNDFLRISSVTPLQLLN